MNNKVTVTHPEYDKYKDIWKRCRDVVSGEDAVKAATITYLPIPTGQDDGQYRRYLQRARFFNATQRIVDSMIGQIFRRSPIIDPEKLNGGYITQDGDNIIQYSKKVLREIVTVGRVGTLIDHGQSIEGETYLVMYTAEDIINWKYEVKDGMKIPTLIVLKESVPSVDATFAHDYEIRYRVLKLVDGIYKQNIWRKEKNEYIESEDIRPLMDGKPLDYIPFFILTSSGISLDVYKPIIKDVVDLNIGHYINSADFENDLHWSGIKTPCFPGWNTELGPIPIGKPMATPVGSQPFMLESTAGSAIKDEMIKKEERMAVIGAQIIAQQGRYVQAAETASISRIGETSILSSLSDNLDNYFTKILEIVALWSNAKDVDISISFNKDFDPGEVNMDELIKAFGLVQARGLAYSTFFDYAKRKELVPRDRTAEEEIQTIDDEQKEKAAKELLYPPPIDEEEEKDLEDDTE